MAYKGKFSPRNPQKYKGDPTNIVFRSRWELKVMDRLDRDPNVLAWSSESIIVPYKDKASGRSRRYFPDFYVKTKDREMLVEVKPGKETRPPSRTGKSEKRFLAECRTWATNSSKWEAAERFCAQRGWIFVKWTEREIGV